MTMLALTNMFHVTAQYSNAVLVALMPYVTEFSFSDVWAEVDAGTKRIKNLHIDAPFGSWQHAK